MNRLVKGEEEGSDRSVYKGVGESVYRHNGCDRSKTRLFCSQTTNCASRHKNLVGTKE
jgi:hypothetical protein